MKEEFMIFPIKDPRGFEVRTEDDYRQLMLVIGRETLNLMTEFPGKHLWVVYETEQETN